MARHNNDAATAELDRCHQAIIDAANSAFGRDTVTPEIERAFRSTPRHAFAPRYLDGRLGRWADLDASALESQLPTIYADRPLCILQDERGRVVSTISQPSLVLAMLRILELRPGMNVFELGGGSGWNAALMGRMVEPGGRVFSVEIEPALVRNARSATAGLGIDNVEIIEADGTLGWPEAAPYDRGVFTASASSLPAAFFDQIKDGGVLVAVLALYEGVDLLAALRKHGSRFVSETHFPCNFVAVTGQLANRKVDTTSTRRKRRKAERIRPDDQGAFARFLKIVGSPSDDADYQALADLWLASQKPDVEELELTVYPADAPPPAAPKQWIVHRASCCMAWSLRQS